MRARARFRKHLGRSRNEHNQSPPTLTTIRVSRPLMIVPNARHLAVTTTTPAYAHAAVTPAYSALIPLLRV
eukprot:TRINITY_DN3411_c0_g1_i1.p1 TRINITY_DN3411_c0_g1~~TRINITY_DN3411_c0_g1_i1.p1  ORF type:complete len:71 (+),score=27.13 TRINITY_DN3411_c0_g1_i1:286-498(+)